MSKFDLDNVDSLKIYVYMMGGLVVISLVWLFYNYQLSQSYQKEIKKAKRDFDFIAELEKEIVAKGILPVKEEDEEQEKLAPSLANAFAFFKNFVRGLSEIPEVTIHPPEPGSNDFGDYNDYRFTVSFEKGIDRENLVRYIFKIQEAKDFLRLQRIEINRVENIPTYQDSWRSSMDFAYRVLDEQ